MRAPLPRQSLQPASSPTLQGGNVVPFQDFSAGQTQALGQTLLKGGVELMNTADWLQDRYDEAEAKGADSRLAETIQKVMRDPKTGYLGRIGKDAVGKPREDAFKQIDREIEETERSLTTEQQRMMFRNRAAQRRLEAIADADAHEVRQIRTHSIGAAKVQADGFESEAYSYGVEMERLRRSGASAEKIAEAKRKFDVAVGAMTNEVNTGSDLAGWTGDSPIRGAAIRERMSSLHGKIIATLADGEDSAGAARWLATYGDQIDPQEREKLKQIVNKATNLGEAMRSADIYWDGGRAEVRREKKYGVTDVDERARLDSVDLTEAEMAMAEEHSYAMMRRDFASGVLSAEARDIVERQLSARFVQARTSAAQIYDGTKNEAKKWVEENPNKPFDQAPVTLQDRVDRLGMRKEMDRFIDEGGTLRTDRVGMRFLTSSDDPTWLRQFSSSADLAKEVGDHLSIVDFRHIMRKYSEAKSGVTMAHSLVETRVRNLIDNALGADAYASSSLDDTANGRALLALSARLRDEAMAKIVAQTGNKAGEASREVVDSVVKDVMSLPLEKIKDIEQRRQKAIKDVNLANQSLKSSTAPSDRKQFEKALGEAQEKLAAAEREMLIAMHPSSRDLQQEGGGENNPSEPTTAELMNEIKRLLRGGK